MLHTIVRNGARNERKKHARAKEHLVVDDTPLPAHDPAPDEALAQTETVAQLEGCMARLDDVHRHVVTLRVLEGCPATKPRRRSASRPGTLRAPASRAQGARELHARKRLTDGCNVA